MINIYLARVWDGPVMDQNLIQPHASASNTKNIIAPLIYFIFQEKMFVGEFLKGCLTQFQSVKTGTLIEILDLWGRLIKYN